MRNKPRPHAEQRRNRQGRPASKRGASAAPALLRLEALGKNRFAFRPPHCAGERDADLKEVRAMISAGEEEIARDELLYLVADCRAFLEAHNMLGDLALRAADLAVARGHFGFAYELALASLPKGFRGRLPADRHYNRQFFRAGVGLARCLIARGRPREAQEVLDRLAGFDAREENVQLLLRSLQRGQEPAAPVGALGKAMGKPEAGASNSCES